MQGDGGFLAFLRNTRTPLPRETEVLRRALEGGYFTGLDTTLNITSTVEERFREHAEALLNDPSVFISFSWRFDPLAIFVGPHAPDHFSTGGYVINNLAAWPRWEPQKGWPT